MDIVQQYTTLSNSLYTTSRFQLRFSKLKTFLINRQTPKERIVAIFLSRTNLTDQGNNQPQRTLQIQFL